jgi:Rhodanese-like domain
VQNHRAQQFGAAHKPAARDKKQVIVDAGDLMRAFSIVALFALTLAMAADSPTVEPKELAGRLANAPRTAIFQVGVGYQYRANHIPGAVYAGPASRPDGIELLKSAAEKLPRDREIVIYCGCCPWDKCPNIKPAIELLKGMGFTRVTALRIPTTFKADWIDQAYPVEHGDAAK